MLDKQREDQYKKFKDTISNQNNQDHGQDLDRSRLFINKIKEHRHDKIKTKHTKKFKKLQFKHYGYHHNIKRHTTSYNNTDSDSNTLRRQLNVPSRFSTSSPQLPQLPVFLPHPWPPHLPPMQQLPIQHPGSHHPAPAIHVPATWTNG